MGLFSSLSPISVASNLIGSVGGSDPTKIALSMIPGVGGFLGQQEANSANALQAQNQMNFQERMSNTSYQRGVEDLKAAGLNPALAYSQGGASTPTGSMATMQNANASLESTLSGTLGLISLKKDLEQKSENVNLTKQQTKNAEWEQLIKESDARTKNVEAMDASHMQAARDNTKGYYQALAKTIKQQNLATAKEAQVAAKHAEYDAKAAPIDAVLRRLPSIISPANAAKKLLQKD